MRFTHKRIDCGQCRGVPVERKTLDSEWRGGAPSVAAAHRCPNPKCRQELSSQARYCLRCGLRQADASWESRSSVEDEGGSSGLEQTRPWFWEGSGIAMVLILTTVGVSTLLYVLIGLTALLG